MRANSCAIQSFPHEGATFSTQPRESAQLADSAVPISIGIVEGSIRPSFFLGDALRPNSMKVIPSHLSSAQVVGALLILATAAFVLNLRSLPLLERSGVVRGGSEPRDQIDELPELKSIPRHQFPLTLANEPTSSQNGIINADHFEPNQESRYADRTSRFPKVSNWEKRSGR